MIRDKAWGMQRYAQRNSRTGARRRLSRIYRRQHEHLAMFHVKHSTLGNIWDRLGLLRNPKWGQTPTAADNSQGTARISNLHMVPLISVGACHCTREWLAP